MKMIELKYKKHLMSKDVLKKTVIDKNGVDITPPIFTVGGFELEAPQTSDFQSTAGVIRKGKLSTQFRLNVPNSRLCEVPDTQWNRDKLKEKFITEKDGTKYFIFEIISDINLEEEAPHAGGGEISKDEERSLKQQISELKDKNLRLDADLKMAKIDAKLKADKKAKKEADKKIGGKTKTEEDTKAPGALNLEPDLV